MRARSSDRATLARSAISVVWDERSSWYDGVYDAQSAEGYALRARLEAVLTLLHDICPGSILDAGMGPGRLCAELSVRGWTTSGVDASREMVELARSRLPEAARRLHVASIEALPFGDASFDAVTATGVLEYADLTAALTEIARVLRPGGVAVVSYPNPRALYGAWKTRAWYPAVRATKRAFRTSNPGVPHGAGEQPPERFVALLAAAGLVPGSVIHASYMAVPTPFECIAPRAASRLAAHLEARAPRGGRRLATQLVYRARRSGEPPDGGGEA